MRYFLLLLSAAAALAQSISPLQSRGYSIQLTNASGGTTLFNLAKIDSSGHAATAQTTDTAIPVYIVIYGAGTSGTVTLGAGGVFTCQMDPGGVTVGHFVGASTGIAGKCGDLGSVAPTARWVIGQALNSAAANANAIIDLSQGYNAASTSIACIGNPGNTTGSYRQLCQTSAGALYACNNSSGCTVAADWVGQGGGGYTAGSGINISGPVISVIAPAAFQADVQSGTYTSINVTSTGTNVITATASPPASSYSAFPIQHICMIANYTGGIASINIGTVGAKNAYLADGVSSISSTVSGNPYCFDYNSSLNSGAGGWQGASANLAVSSAATPTEFTFAFPIATGYPISWSGGWPSTSGSVGYNYFSIAANQTGSLYLQWSVPHRFNPTTSSFYLVFEGQGVGNDTITLTATTGYFPATGSSLTFNPSPVTVSQVTSGLTNYTFTSPALPITGLAADAPVVFQIQASTSGQFYMLESIKVYMTP